MLLTLFALLPVAAAYSATIGTQFPIATTAMKELSVGAAFDGTNFLVGIQGDAANSNNVTAQLVSQSGTLVGPRISVGRTGGAPSVAFDGANYLLVWPDNATNPSTVFDVLGSDTNPSAVLYGQFIGTTGTLVGSAFQIGPLGVNAKTGGVAYGGGKYLITYYQLVDAVQGTHKAFGRIVSPSGTVGSELPISTGLGSHAVLQNAAFDGSNFLVVWIDDGNDYAVMGRFVSPSGTLGTEFTVNASRAPSDNLGNVAFDGTHYLVVWADEVSGGPFIGNGVWQLFGQLVDTSGTLVGGVIAVTSAPASPQPSFLAFDGTNFLVIWSDQRNDTNRNGICDSGEGSCWDIYGRFISPSGVPVGAEFSIITDAGNQYISPVVYGGGQYLVAWTSADNLQVPTIGDVYGALITNATPTGGTSITPTTPLPPPPTTQAVFTVPSGQLPETAVVVSATGTFGHANLSVTLDIVRALQATTASGFAASTYNVYVAALVPGGVIGAANPAWYVKAKALGWGPLQSPIAAYLENVTQAAANNQVLIEILTYMDISSLAGTEVYIGYGTSDTEMLTAGRYRGIYKVQ